jgi:hypothetical protein
MKEPLGRFNPTSDALRVTSLQTPVRRSGIDDNALIYGTMYGDDIAQVVTVASANVVYAVGGGLSGGVINGMTFQNNSELRCNDAGLYLIIWSMSLRPANNGDTVSGTVMINSTGLHVCEGSAYFANANRPQSMGGTTILDLQANDVIRLAVENETAAHNITIDHASLTVVKLAYAASMVLPISSDQFTLTIAGSLAVGSGALRFYNSLGRTVTLTKVLISVGTAPFGAYSADGVLIDVHMNGTTIFTNQAHRPLILSEEYTGVASKIDIDTLHDGDYLTLDIDHVGSSVAGSDLTVMVTYI